MGNMEQTVARQVRRSKIQRAVLGAIAVAGVLGVALVAPNALQILAMFDKDIRRKTNPKYAASRAFWRLVGGGYITLEKTARGQVARLTAKGEKITSILDKPNVVLKKPRRWDGKWRVIIFDIKERRRGTRDRLRRTLERLDFKHLQHSVWVYPYDCEDLIILLKADFKIGIEVLYMIVDRIENDAPLRKHFFLP